VAGNRSGAVNVVIGSLEPPRCQPEVEIVERKGIGHPDTICDALAEHFSVALSRFYLERFGTILHHNVDKALLRGGAARAVFGGGEILEPIDVYLAGRAATSVGGVSVPVLEIAEQSARAWLRAHLRALDADRHVRIHCLVRPGSVDLAELFTRQRQAGVPLANDTSFGVGYAPSSPLETFTLALERGLNSPGFLAAHPSHGEDVKVMAVRHGDDVSLTVARALVSAHVPSLGAYIEAKRALGAHVAGAAGAIWGDVNVNVNAADAPDGSAIYLTVTGTSAESGDDGQVGRGNRASGLITPFRPMSLEALAGKNPVSHVGKLYNLAARAIAEQVVARVPNVHAAECYLVSRIGAPIDEPALALTRLGTEGPQEPAQAEVAREIVLSELAGIRNMWRAVLDGTLQIF
jgi:S-adenosylmethionine synthetase